jgi:murein DD-endopeptidase MepM/ murein hydrolase activator NlpD
VPPIAMPEADARPLAARVPAPRAALDDAALAPAAPVEAAVEAPAENSAPTGRFARRLPQPPGRRAPLWLAALIAGALVAAGPSVLGDDEPTAVDASDYGLGVGGEDLSGLDEAGVRRGITEAEARARLSELAASRAAREPKFASPVSSYRLTSCYCERWGTFHWGLDMAAGLGTPIYSVTDGVVLEAGPASGYGNAVYIQDEDGYVHVYGHMRYYSVRGGDIVRAGQTIASVGDEGYSTGPHLHYEIHQGGRDGAPTNPQTWLEARGVPVG